METKKKLNRKKHGTGNTSNQFKLTIYRVNPPRDSFHQKGSNKFETTKTFRDIKTLQDVFDILDNEPFSLSQSDGSRSFSPIKNAYYNGHILISNGKLLSKYINKK